MSLKIVIVFRVYAIELLIIEFSYRRGFSDPIFGMSAVFATFVMYDAQVAFLIYLIFINLRLVGLFFFFARVQYAFILLD